MRHCECRQSKQGVIEGSWLQDRSRDGSWGGQVPLGLPLISLTPEAPGSGAGSGVAPTPLNDTGCPAAKEVPSASVATPGSLDGGCRQSSYHPMCCEQVHGPHHGNEGHGHHGVGVEQ
jgi:hypothetical protein